MKFIKVNISEMGKNTHPLVGKLTLGSLTVRISYSTDTASRRRAIAEGAWDRDLRPLGSVESRGDLNPGNTSCLRGSVGRRTRTGMALFPVAGLVPLLSPLPYFA